MGYDKFLIIGATGRTGELVVKQLLEANKEVAICVRSKTKARGIFKNKIEDIKTVVEHELGYFKESKDLEAQVEWCDVLIDASAAPIGGNPQIADYDKTVELLAICKKFNLKKFVLISTARITKPYGYPALFLNFLISYVMGWKALAENKLRQSGLDYIIVRPGRLTDEKNSETTSVQLLQGDSVIDKTSRANTAKTAIQCLLNPNTDKKKITFEVFDIEKKVSYFEIPRPLKEDTDKSFITVDHFKATKRLSILFYTIAFLILLFIISKVKQ